MKFAPGDTVHLKSGVPLMIVALEKPSDLVSHPFRLCEANS